MHAAKSFNAPDHPTHRSLLSTITMNTGYKTLAAALAAVLLLACPAVQGQIEGCDATIGELAEATNFTVLASLLNATGLYDALNNSFTVFAPTDSTFLKTLTTLNIDPAVLTSPAVLPTLASILTYHVVPNAVPLELIKSQPVTTVTTVAGTPLTINFDASATPGVTVTAAESTAKVLDPQVPGEPGIAVSTECFIHVFPIDAILLPAGATAILGTLSGVKP